MNGSMLRQHLFRAYARHWPLQFASISVMTMVLVILNFMFLGFSTFNQLVESWGRGMEMIVYVKEGISAHELAQLKKKIETSGEFEKVQFTSKPEATRKFLEALGPESAELLKDPKWSSPIPASFELQLSSRIPMERRLASLHGWSERLQDLQFVDEVFYGKGWVENFSRFLSGARGLVAWLWVLSLSVGLLIVGNCIRLSFLQRREEIEVLELVGATSRFIRVPFLIEGLILGLTASLLSLALSFGLNSLLLNWASDQMSFWIAMKEIPPLQPWYVAANISSGVMFGVVGAWNCVRKLNTGWSAAAL